MEASHRIMKTLRRQMNPTTSPTTSQPATDPTICFVFGFVSSVLHARGMRWIVGTQVACHDMFKLMDRAPWLIRSLRVGARLGRQRPWDRWKRGAS